jgi:hypothetical protein
MEQQIADLIITFASSNPTLTLVMSVMAGARIFIKPIMTAALGSLDKAANTPEVVAKFPIIKKIDDFMDGAEKSTAYRAFAWTIDYLFSIKVIK